MFIASSLRNVTNAQCKCVFYGLKFIKSDGNGCWWRLGARFNAEPNLSFIYSEIQIIQ